jgi:hypothetical protein
MADLPVDAPDNVPCPAACPMRFPRTDPGLRALALQDAPASWQLPRPARNLLLLAGTLLRRHSCAADSAPSAELAAGAMDGLRRRPGVWAPVLCAALVPSAGLPDVPAGVRREWAVATKELLQSQAAAVQPDPGPVGLVLMRDKKERPNGGGAASWRWCLFLAARMGV